MPNLALTGGFGTGKTTVLKMFEKLGASTVNIDSMVHDILRDSRVIRKSGNILGDTVIDRIQGVVSINRRRAAEIIFRDPLKRRAFEKLIHPIVLRRIRRLQKQILRGDPASVIVFEVPLLFEAGFERYFDKIAVVYCTRRTALLRLRKKGLHEDDVILRMRAQLPMIRKRRAAHFVIDNSGTTAQTEARVRRVYHKVSGPQIA